MKPEEMPERPAEGRGRAAAAGYLDEPMIQERVPPGVVPPSMSMAPPPTSDLQGSPTAGSSDLHERITARIRRRLGEPFPHAAGFLTDAAMMEVQPALDERDGEIAQLRQWLNGAIRERDEQTRALQSAHDRAMRQITDLVADRDRQRRRAERTEAEAKRLRDIIEVRRPDDTWTVAVEVPMNLPIEMRHTLFTAISAAAQEWKPEDRDGWDVDVSGYPTAHDLAHTEREALNRAEAAIAEVRRFCEMVIASSIRVQAIDQATDTIAVLDRSLKKTR